MMITPIARCLVFAALGLFVSAPGGAAGTENLLRNPDFGEGEPGTAESGWILDTRAGAATVCTVVSGRTPEAKALRLYNDELGKAYVHQTVTVHPWRWYVAEVWVNTENMASFGFAPWIELRGERRVNGDRYELDWLEWPQKGWRRVHVVTHAADKAEVTLELGGGWVAGGWSGEILFCEPVLRECSQVEAAGRYPSPCTQDPRLFGPVVAPEQNEHGYIFQRSKLCRVVSGFPNPFRLVGRMNKEAPEARVSLVLPPGIRYRCQQYGKIDLSISDIRGGYQRLEMPPDSQEIVLDSDLRPGERAVGYASYEWRGGFQLPAPVHFEGISFPDAPQLRRLPIMLTIGGYQPNAWRPDEAAGLDATDVMIRDFKRFGFNSLEIWGGDARGYYRRGMPCGAQWGGSFYGDEKKFPEALAVTVNGDRCGGGRALNCPSYRGPALEPFIERVRESAETITSRLTVDDEYYAGSALSPMICFCERCGERWKEWRAKNAPGLADVDLAEFGRRPHKYLAHYDAWLRFRCQLVAERYKLLRDAFHAAVREHGTESWPEPQFGVSVGGGPLVGLHGNASLAKTLDYVANMVYDTCDGVRRRVAELAPRTGGKLFVTLAPGYMYNGVGETRSKLLETLMGGSKGVLLWGYYMGIDAGQLFEVAEAVTMLAPVEDVVADGRLEPGWNADRESANLTVRRLDNTRVVLVSDYSPNPGPVTITVPTAETLEVTDLYSGARLARLTKDRRTFTVHALTRDFRARLYRIAPQARRGWDWLPF